MMKTIPDKSIDITITSPPYNIGKKYGSYKDNRDDYLDFLYDMLAEIRRTSRCLWLNLGYRKLDIGNVPIAFQVWDKVGMHLVQSIRWEYGSGMTYKKRFNHRSEDWLWYADSDAYIFNSDAVRDPKLNKTWRKNYNSDGKIPSDVWFFNQVVNNAKDRTPHPAQFPVPMIERIIKASSHKDMTILDPFMGSGSTGVAAINTGRRFIGIERDETYYGVALNRLQNTIDRLQPMNI